LQLYNELTSSNDQINKTYTTMKKITFLLLLMILICGTAMAKSHHKIHQTVENVKDTTATQAVDTTTYSPTYEDSVDEAADNDNQSDDDFQKFFSRTTSDLANSPAVFIPIVGTIFSCLLVAVIIFCAFYFPYKSRKAKYQMMEKAIEKGQPIPNGMFDKVPTKTLKNGKVLADITYMRDKGIKKIFIGLGLFIFFWAIDSISLGCIGLIIVLIGASQCVTWYFHVKDAEKYAMNDTSYNDKQGSSSLDDTEDKKTSETDIKATDTSEENKIDEVSAEEIENNTDKEG
jgi:hypothetical protein